MDKLFNIKPALLQGTLFLRGVYKKDCKRIEDMFQDKLMSENVKLQETKIYDKIPVCFTSLETWPQSTNLACWRCSRTFKNRPWFEANTIEPIGDTRGTGLVQHNSRSHPTKHNTIYNYIGGISTAEPSVRKNKALAMSVHGVFCSPNCVRAYIDLHTKDLSERLNKISMLKYEYEIFCGKSIPDIQPSPDPTEMVQYGGSTSASDYQQKIDNLDVSYQRELEDNNFASICNNFIKTLPKEELAV